MMIPQESGISDAILVYLEVILKARYLTVFFLPFKIHRNRNGDPRNYIFVFGELRHPVTRKKHPGGVHKTRTSEDKLSFGIVKQPAMPPRRQALSLVALCASLAVASCASANQADSKITPWSFLKNLLSNAAPEKRDPVKMRLIGAGFGRTGTMSLKTALTELGYQVCEAMQVAGLSTNASTAFTELCLLCLSPPAQTYHMKEGVIDGGDVPLWSRYALASPSDKVL